MKLRPNGMHIGHPCFLPDDYMRRVRKNLAELEASGQRSANRLDPAAGGFEPDEPFPSDEPEPWTE